MKTSIFFKVVCFIINIILLGGIFNVTAFILLLLYYDQNETNYETFLFGVIFLAPITYLSRILLRVLTVLDKDRQFRNCLFIGFVNPICTYVVLLVVGLSMDAKALALVVPSSIILGMLMPLTEKIITTLLQAIISKTKKN